MEHDRLTFSRKRYVDPGYQFGKDGEYIACFDILEGVPKTFSVVEWEKVKDRTLSNAEYHLYKARIERYWKERQNGKR